MGSVRKWADFCSDDEDQGNDIDHDDVQQSWIDVRPDVDLHSVEENVEDQSTQGNQTAVVLVDEAPLAQSGGQVTRAIEDKMIEIAHILGVNVEGRIEELKVLIREIVEQEHGRKNQSGVPKARRKPKGSRELLNLASSINYDKQGVEKKKGVEMLGL